MPLDDVRKPTFCATDNKNPRAQQICEAAYATHQCVTWGNLAATGDDHKKLWHKTVAQSLHPPSKKSD